MGERPAPLVAAVRAAKQFLTYTSPAPFQLAVARGLGFAARTPWARLAAELAARRDQLCDGLEALGYDGVPARRHLLRHDRHRAGGAGLSALDFCLALPGRCGVVAIPSSVFYDPADPEAGPDARALGLLQARSASCDDALARLASWAP